ncbi:MAG: endopeptidase La [Candidatus Shikimatogenerans bostrichidophilus]|nr:MAG: endopeptidase La [Candidatus Shikimatogenerans bostrichidophilus]
MKKKKKNIHFLLNYDFEYYNNNNNIPLIKINKKKIKKNKNINIPNIIKIFLIKDIILFPNTIIPILIKNVNYINYINKLFLKKKYLGIITRKNKIKVYDIGNICLILKIFKINNKNFIILLKTIKIFKIKKLINNKNKILKSKIIILKNIKCKNKNKEKIFLNIIKELSIKIIKNNLSITNELILLINNIYDLSLLINFITINYNINFKKKQKILRENNIKKKSIILIKYLNYEYNNIKLKKNIQKKVINDINKQQKEYYLNQQLKFIQKKLGYFILDKELKKLKNKSKKKNWSNKVNKHFNNEFNKLKTINNQMPEYNMLKSYLEFMINLPWNKYSKDNFNLKKAILILNKNHYGLENIKNRILEYLSLLKLKGNMKAPILCFFGPPGVGKTSLGKSISEVLHRKYVRMSLGGIHDESVIRGHRKTYVGAMPGRILQLIKKIGTSNPVFVLDEIDKISLGGYNGDPSAAMLEVLDPEQNNNFYDNYLEVGYDLSKVLFIATANSLNNINKALLDRMEIINISGYNIEEKINIAKKFLLPKKIKENGFKSNFLNITNKKFKIIIENYTYESGIRNLERCINRIISYTAKNIVMKKRYKKNINFKYIQKVLGYSNNIKKYKKNNDFGISIGLAWTNLGGDIIYIESCLLKGKGEITITGNIGKIMKESIIIAIKYIKSNYKILNINYKLFINYSVHLHIPEGSIPKDGPSAGITILIALISLYTKKKIKSYLAMTGEITLKGKILEVGGIKEKILAAKRAYINNIILPNDNKKDILNINKKYLLDLKFYYVKNVKDVIKLSFNNEK